MPTSAKRKRWASESSLSLWTEGFGRRLNTVFYCPHLTREAAGGFSPSRTNALTLSLQRLRKAEFARCERSRNHGEAVVKLKKFRFGWHVECVAMP